MAAASLSAPTALLHVLETVITVAVVLALPRLRPAALAGVIAGGARSQSKRVGMGGAKDAGNEGCKEDDEVALHFVEW